MKNENEFVEQEFIIEKNLRKAFSIVSYEVFQYLNEEDIRNLRATNKYFLDMCDCNQLFNKTMKSLVDLFKKELIIEDEDNRSKNNTKTSKFKEKFNFNKSMNDLYKHSEEKPPNIVKIHKKN